MKKPRLKKIQKKKFEARTIYQISETATNHPKGVSFEQEDKYLKDQAEVLFQKILVGKKKIAFDVAFCILNGFNNGKNLGLCSSLKRFLEGLVKLGNCPDKYKTLKLAYYVARVFGDLEKEENRKVAFESYRKIANATLFFKKSLSDEENQQKIETGSTNYAERWRAPL